jgi:2-polyprenyl-6-methoxyphenol hydroxylase-like FAD-dependent oxidoreductase
LTQEIKTSVLIVGAGPVGLSLAIELGHRGVACVVVEQHDRVGYAPRAKTTNARSREHLRRWGIAEDLRKASRLPPDYPSDIIFATRLNGYFLARIPNAFNCAPERNDLYSESGQWIPQYALEEVLRGHATTLPAVAIRFNSRLIDAKQSDTEVTAVIKDTVNGRETSVRSTYLIGADGGRSAIRELIGAQMMGARAFSPNFNVQFRAPDLHRLHKHDRAIQYWMVNDDVPALVGPMDGLDLWYMIAARIDRDSAGIDPKELIRRATGMDFEMEILGTDPWVAHSLIADRYSRGRLFLAGDACHLHPPFGGYGMNMGIGDAVDLGWKMAAVLQGWGGPKLLESYEIERRPVHQRVIEEAVANYASVGNTLFQPGLETPSPQGDPARREMGETISAVKLREFKNLGVVLGYRYKESPIVVSDGSEPPPEHFMNYVPSAHPGCLAPHLWLRDGTSLYDHFGRDFTLLITEGDEIAVPGSIPIKTITPRDERLRARYQARFALIRPDQHVAWRGDIIPKNFDGILNQVRGATVI